MIPRILPPLAFFLIALLSGCLKQGLSVKSHEITGTEPERIAAVGRILESHLPPLPGAIGDPHFLEEQVGDGRLGPSDYSSFCAFDVLPKDLPKWTAALTAHGGQKAAKRYAAPRNPTPWWVSEKDHATLDFYDPQALSGRVNGWIGIDASSGKIYVYSFTM